MSVIKSFQSCFLKQDYIRNSRGVELFICRWIPSSSPKALVFLCHGKFIFLYKNRKNFWWVKKTNLVICAGYGMECSDSMRGTWFIFFTTTCMHYMMCVVSVCWVRHFEIFEENQVFNDLLLANLSFIFLGIHKSNIFCFHFWLNTSIKKICWIYI